MGENIMYIKIVQVFPSDFVTNGQGSEVHVPLIWRAGFRQDGWLWQFGGDATVSGTHPSKLSSMNDVNCLGAEKSPNYS